MTLTTHPPRARRRFENRFKHAYGRVRLALLDLGADAQEIECLLLQLAELGEALGERNGLTHQKDTNATHEKR